MATNKSKITMAMALALGSSFAWASWSILSDILVSINNKPIFSYLLISYSVAVLLSLLLFLFIRKQKHQNRPILTRISPILAGIGFGVGNIILLTLIGNTNYPFVVSMLFSSVVFMAVLIKITTKEKLKVFYFIGTALVFVGLILQALALYGNNISASIPIIIASVITMLFFTAGYYLVFYPLYKGEDPIVVNTKSFLTILLVVILGGLVLGGFSTMGQVTSTELLLSFGVAITLLLASYSGFLATRLVRKMGAKYLNLSEILTSLEIIGVALFSIFLLSIVVPEFIVGIFVLFLGIVTISLS